MIRSKSLDERALTRMVGSQRHCLKKATRKAKTAPLMKRSMKISECELDDFKRKPGPKVESSMTIKGDQSLLEDTSSKFQTSRFRASLKPSSPLPKSSRHREITRSKSVTGHEYQQEKTILGPKRTLSMSRNKEMATSKLAGQTALTRKLHLNVNSGEITKRSQRHDREGNTNQLHASRFKEPLHAESSRHQYEIIRLDSLDEDDPFEMEMQSTQNSAGTYTKTEDIAANFTDQ